jgi:hypothetical protein
MKDRIITETRAVYRAAKGTKGRLTRIAAYRDAAWNMWLRKHWPEGCGCDHNGHLCLYHDWDDGDTAWWCDRRRVVVARLARWLMWADGKPSKAKSLQVSYRSKECGREDA